MSLKAGSPEFIEMLLRRKFAQCPDLLTLPHGAGLLELMQAGMFTRPILIKRPDGLDMTVPASDLRVPDIVALAGARDGEGEGKFVDVVDVREQRDFRMGLAEFAAWWEARGSEGGDGRLLNLLSLEISDTRLGELVQAPAAVRQMSLVARCCRTVNAQVPAQTPQAAPSALPEMLKFCLISAAGSYTDFHIDFGGSSVWYHVLRGEKIFYLLPPTDSNLAAYETWMASEDNLITFLGDRCKRETPKELRVRAGDTVLLPSGWIHAVYTPVDSVAFGGNFLHNMAMPMQIRVYEMELRLGTESRFLFPYFEKLHWLAAGLLRRELSASGSPADVSKEQRSLCRQLCLALGEWLRRMLLWQTEESDEDDKAEAKHGVAVKVEKICAEKPAEDAVDRSFFLPDTADGCPEDTEPDRLLAALAKFGWCYQKALPPLLKRKIIDTAETDAVAAANTAEISQLNDARARLRLAREAKAAKAARAKRRCELGRMMKATKQQRIKEESA